MEGRFVILVLASILILGTLGLSYDAFATTITETQKVFPSEEFIDDFGISVSIDGSTAVVGAIFDWDQDNLTDPGAAYIYEKNSEGVWIQVQVIRPSGSPDDVQFGNAVAVSGDTIVVGARFEDRGTGAVYIFEKGPGGWPSTETQKIIASDVESSDNFGTSVDISRDTVIVGSFSSNAGIGFGAAYIFDKTGSTWPTTETKKILPSDGATDFGSSVSIDANTAVVGASFDDAGSAYIFEKNAGVWPATETKKIIPSDGALDDDFGTSVAISGDTVIVGSPRDDDNGSNSGSAYIFEKGAGGWPATETKKILPSDGTSSDDFGTSVTISGDIAIVGSIDAEGFVDGEFLNVGAAYAFVKKQGVWPMTESLKIQSLVGEEDAEFGISVSMSGDNVIISAIDVRFANGNTGAAYFFKVPLTETQKILASNGFSEDVLGISVSISGDTAIAGAIEHDQDGEGSAYIYERNSEGVWIQVQQIRAGDDPSDDHFFDEFGWSVAIDGNTAVVSSEVDTRFGTVYIFEKTGGVWPATETKIITSGDPDSFARDGFGFSVAISGDTIAIGYAERDSDPTTVRDAAGTVYILERDNGGADNWGRVAKLSSDAPVRGDFLGHSVAISGNTVIAGAPFANSGAAYIFEKPASGWTDSTQTKKLLASDGVGSDEFGFSVDISGNTAIVGAKKNDDSGSRSGSAYIFEKNAGVWPATETKKLLASDADARDEFGITVAISGDKAIVGSSLDDDACLPTVDTICDSGSVYIFEKNAGVWPETETNKGLASDGEASDNFGNSVSMSTDRAIVGSWLDDAAGVPPAEVDFDNFGSAYIFEFAAAEPEPEVADLSLEKTIELNVAITRGDTFTYFLKVKNIGPDEAVNVVVTDELPSVAPLDVTFVDVTPGAPVCMFSSGTVTCNLGNMAVDDEKDIGIVVKTNDKAPLGEIILNEATVSSDIEDPNPLNDKGMVSFEIEATIWDGGGDGINWSDPFNWNSNDVPKEANQIIIQDAAGIVHLNTNHEITDDGFLTIIGSNTLEIDSGKKLTNNSDETITIASGATLIVKGVLENSGTLTNQGTIDNKAKINNKGDFINKGTINNFFDGVIEQEKNFNNKAGAKIENFGILNVMAELVNEAGAEINNKFVEPVEFGNIHIPMASKITNSGTVNDCAIIDFPYKIKPNIPVLCDMDGDSLLDSWEEFGIDFNHDKNIDLPLAQIKPDHKDILIEIDYLSFHEPKIQAINDVITAFQNAPIVNPDGVNGITLHVDIDESIPENAANMDLNPVWAEFDAIKADHFGTEDQRDAGSEVIEAKKLVYKYNLWAHSHSGKGSSGKAEFNLDSGNYPVITLGPGNDFIVTLGINWPLNDAGTHNVGNMIHHSGTFMHEMGHTFSLGHGGADSNNLKPNYISIMNYLFQMTYPEYGNPLDYSRSSITALNEKSLIESNGVGDSTPLGLHTGNAVCKTKFSTEHQVDWNCNGTTDDDLSMSPMDLNHRMGDAAKPIDENLVGQNDWTAIQYNFRNEATSFADGDHPEISDVIFEEMTFEDAEFFSSFVEDTPLGADISIQKNGPSEALAGDTFGYHIRVDNFGPDESTNPRVTDTIPIEIVALDLTSTDPINVCTFNESTRVLQCLPPDIPPNSFFDVFFDVTVDSNFSGPEISNQASVNSDNDPNPDNNTSDPLITTITPPPPPPGPISADHYLGYKVKETKYTDKFQKFTVRLSDQFETNVEYKIEKPDRLYNPVQKTLEDGTTTEITDEITHYVGYKIKIPQGDPKFEKRNVLVENQFGEIIVDVKKPKLLLVPSLKAHDDFPMIVDPFTINHYKCYDVKETKGTDKFVKRIVSVFDPNFDITKDFEVKKPKMLCNPVEKQVVNADGTVETTPIQNPENHLMCYDLKKIKDQPKFEKRNVFTDNQFGPEDLEVKKEHQLCVPSIKTLL